MSREENIISILAYELRRALLDDSEVPALREADDYLWEKGWFVPNRESGPHLTPRGHATEN